MKMLCAHPKSVRGCRHCGMRGWILYSYKAACCGRKVWSDGWPKTVYAGKIYETFNGVVLTVESLSPFKETCDSCLYKKGKR